MNCKNCMQDCQKIGCDIELKYCTDYIPKEMEPWTDEELESIKNALEKNSVSTGINIYNLFDINPINGDIYWNPGFGDLWIVDDKDYVKINDGYRTEIENTVGFIKVGHVNVETR